MPPLHKTKVTEGFFNRPVIESTFVITIYTSGHIPDDK